MPTDHALEAALDRCFVAVAQPETWPVALTALAAALGASGAAFNFAGSPTDRERLKLPASPRYADMLVEFVDDGWISEDLRTRRGWSKVRAGSRVVTEDDMTTAEERATAPIYRDLFARHDLEMFAGIGMRLDDRLWNLNLVRSASEGPFAGAEARRLARLQPTVRRLLMFALEVSRSEDRGALIALEQVALAAVILDSRGLVQQLNTPAEALMGRGLDVRAGRLSAADPVSNAALEAQIAAAAAGRLHDAVFIARNERDPLIVEAAPLKGGWRDLFGLTGVLLLITDTAARPIPTQTLLQRAFGLTGRESAVARALAGGQSSEDIAETMALRHSSVRQIVKSLLEKTNTRRQGALVAKLGRLPRADRHDE